MFAFLDAIRRAGDEVIHGLFFVDANFFVEFLIGGFAIVLLILWGLLVYSSPFWITGGIIYLFSTRKERAAKQQKKLEDRLQEQESAAARADLCNQLSARLVKDLAAMNVNSMSDLGIFMQQNQLYMKITPHALSIIGKGKQLYLLDYKKDFDFEFKNANLPNDKEMQGKLLKLAKDIHGRIGGSIKLNERGNLENDYHQELVGYKTDVEKDYMGVEHTITKPIYKNVGSSWYTSYYITLDPPAPAPAPAPPKTTRVI